MSRIRVGRHDRKGLSEPVQQPGRRAERIDIRAEVDEPFRLHPVLCRRGPDVAAVTVYFQYHCHCPRLVFFNLLHF
ncbi:hypothetical protein D1872_271080 [compost metagenome]